MEIIKNLNNGELTVVLKGELNTLTSMDLERELKNSLDGVVLLTFDFKDLSYITSAGLRILQLCQNAMDDQGGKLVIKNVNAEIKEVFDITGFNEILDIK